MKEQDGRRARSQRSRVKINEAGRQLFVEHGYLATTMESIAERAELAVQTVYHLFGGKPAVLAAVLDTSIVGDHESIPLARRQWFERLESLTEPVDAIAHLVAECVSVLERVAPVYAVVRHASADPDVGRLHDENRAGRRADHRRLVSILHRNGVVRATLDVDEAADRFYALVSEDVYLLLVVDCGWSVDRFRRWLIEAITAGLT